MANGDSSGSPLSRLSVGERPTEAFELLGNETRLAILVALWEQIEPFSGDAAVSFSDLRDSVGTTDSGQFNYHLERLTGHFVESTEAGYELSEAGRTIVRSVISGAGIEEPTLEPEAVDTTCTLCGGGVEVAYENGWVYVRCTECDGLWNEGDDGRTGHLAKFSLDPAGLTGRSAEKIYAAAWVRSFRKLYSMIEGVCSSCSGPVECRLDDCDDHDHEGVCSNCGRRTRVVARFHCTVCKEWAQTTLGGVVKYHPAVVAFCYERGLELQYGFNDLQHIEARLQGTASTVERVSEDPLRVRVTTEMDGDSIAVELDEDLTVAAVGNGDPP